MAEESPAAGADAQFEIDPEVLAAIEALAPMDQVRLTLKDGTIVEGELRSAQGIFNYVETGAKETYTLSPKLSPAEVAAVKTVEVTRRAHEVFAEREAKKFGEWLVNPNPQTRDEIREALLTLGKAIKRHAEAKPAGFGEDTMRHSRRSYQLHAQFDQLADTVELAKTKRKYLCSYAESYEAGSPRRRSEFELLGDLDSMGRYVVPKPSDFDPDVKARRARSPRLPEDYHDLEVLRGSLRMAEEKLKGVTRRLRPEKREHFEAIAEARRREIADGLYYEAQKEKQQAAQPIVAPAEPDPFSTPEAPEVGDPAGWRDYLRVLNDLFGRIKAAAVGMPSLRDRIDKVVALRREAEANVLSYAREHEQVAEDFRLPGSGNKYGVKVVAWTWPDGLADNRVVVELPGTGMSTGRPVGSLRFYESADAAALAGLVEARRWLAGAMADKSPSGAAADADRLALRVDERLGELGIIDYAMWERASAVEVAETLGDLREEARLREEPPPPPATPRFIGRSDTAPPPAPREAPLFQMGQRVIGRRGMNSGRYMTVREICHNGSIYVYAMEGGAFLGAEEIEALPELGDAAASGRVFNHKHKRTDFAPAAPERMKTLLGDFSLTEFEQAGHEAWQIRRVEWVELQRAERRRLGQKEGGDYAASPNVEYEAFHGDAVKRAAEQGREIPGEVLADYPQHRVDPIKYAEAEKLSAKWLKKLREIEAGASKLYGAQFIEPDFGVCALKRGRITFLDYEREQLRFRGLKPTMKIEDAAAHFAAAEYVATNRRTADTVEPGPVAQAILRNEPVGDESPVERIRFNLPDDPADAQLDPLAIGGAEAPIIGLDPDPDQPATCVNRVAGDEQTSPAPAVSERIARLPGRDVAPVADEAADWRDKPLAPVPADVVLSEVDRAALSRTDEYTRKGSFQPIRVTRQQWIEDILASGFTDFERRKFGRAPERLRLHHVSRFDRNGRPLFYECLHPAEIRYAQARREAVMREGSLVASKASANEAPLPCATPAAMSKAQ
jgi:hypothetical protein